MRTKQARIKLSHIQCRESTWKAGFGKPGKSELAHLDSVAHSRHGAVSLACWPESGVSGGFSAGFNTQILSPEGYSACPLPAAERCPQPHNKECCEWTPALLVYSDVHGGPGSTSLVL